MNKQFVITACILIALSIILGAFGAHGLKNLVEADAIEIFEKGVKYQMYSGLGLLVIGLSASKFNFSYNESISSLLTVISFIIQVAPLFCPVQSLGYTSHHLSQLMGIRPVLSI